MEDSRSKRKRHIYFTFREHMTPISKCMLSLFNITCSIDNISVIINYKDSSFISIYITQSHINNLISFYPNLINRKNTMEQQGVRYS